MRTRDDRFIRPVHMSELSAMFVRVVLMEEIGRLTVPQEQARDRFDRTEWAMLTVKLRALGHHLDDIDIGLRVLGPTPREVAEEYAEEIVREAHWLPRTRANREKWAAHKKAEREAQREHEAAVRAEIAAERAGRQPEAKVAWGKPNVQASQS